MFSKLKVFTRPAFVFLIMLLASIPLSSQAPKYSCGLTAPATQPEAADSYLGLEKCGNGSWDSASSSCGGFPIDC